MKWQTSCDYCLLMDYTFMYMNIHEYHRRVTDISRTITFPVRRFPDILYK